MKGIFEAVIVFVLIFSVLGIICLFGNSNGYGYGYEGFKSELNYSSYNNTPSDSYTGMMIGGNSNIECKRIPGHSGLFCTPDSSHQVSRYDQFYDTSSNMTCSGNGLQKGSGNVCLNEEQHRLLTTRGGNASTVRET